MKRWYLDTSVALHAVLPWGDIRASRWLASLGEDANELLSSTLLSLEITRALRRERLELSLAAPVLDRTSLVSIDDGVLRVAATIEAHIKSLDAIHLATCLQLGSGVTVATHDAAMRAVAEQFGYPAFDPLEPGVG